MDTHQKSVAPGLSVVVQQGRLSVALQAADLGEVLAHIGRQANFRVVPGPSPGKRVSARFEGVELEEGIRHLLRLASLNHIFLYARRSMGAVVISEVVESAPETTSEQVSAEPTEMTRRIREVFKLGKQMGREPSDSQESSPSDPR